MPFRSIRKHGSGNYYSAVQLYIYELLFLVTIFMNYDAIFMNLPKYLRSFVDTFTFGTEE